MFTADAEVYNVPGQEVCGNKKQDPTFFFPFPSAQETTTGSGDSSNYSWRIAGLGIPPLAQHDSQVQSSLYPVFQKHSAD